MNPNYKCSIEMSHNQLTVSAIVERSACGYEMDALNGDDISGGYVVGLPPALLGLNHP
jgi:hypothetical protein